jgi:protocatechuate 3,4-dioxygenase, alpha subunit
MTALTPFQTVGPYLSLGLRIGIQPLTIGEGETIVIRGYLLDGAGNGIPDGVLEWWHPSIPEVLRSLTASDGGFAIETVRPAATTAGGATQAPHFAVRVLGRGILTHYMTRVYFADEASNGDDAVLAAVPEARRQTLIARPQSPSEFRFDIVVQGENETVFFDI